VAASIENVSNPSRASRLLIRTQRFSGTSIRVNARMSHRHVQKYCPLDGPCEALLDTAMSEIALSARAHDKILKVARTIADLDQSDAIQPQHLAEAINYRSLDRQLWA
jgi:magnesium chelatase family protein